MQLNTVFNSFKALFRIKKLKPHSYEWTVKSFDQLIQHFKDHEDEKILEIHAVATYKITRFTKECQCDACKRFL